jgi:hypothetical protein
LVGLVWFGIMKISPFLGGKDLGFDGFLIPHNVILMANEIIPHDLEMHYPRSFGNPRVFQADYVNLIQIPAVLAIPGYFRRIT